MCDDSAALSTHGGRPMIKCRITALLVLVGSILAIPSKAANGVPLAHPSDMKAARAKEFGMFLGAAALQYDLCAEKGFAPKSRPSARVMAESFLKTMEQRDHDPKDVTNIREGWQFAKQELAKRAADYDQGRCHVVVATWNRLLPIIAQATK